MSEGRVTADSSFVVNKRYKLELDGSYLLSLTDYYLVQESVSSRFFAHHDLEISLVKSGRGMYLVEGRNYEMRPGDIFVFNNIESHILSRVDSDDGLVNMVVMFDPRFIWSIEGNMFDSGYLDVFFNRSGMFENRLDSENPASGHIRELLLGIEEEFQKKLPRYEMMIKVKLLNILALLARHFDCCRDDAYRYAKRSHNLTLINRAVNYIDSHLSDQIRLEDLAGQVFMNPSYFSSFFKKYMGMNPSEYIARRRVNRAIEFLKSSDRTIMEIAGLCGFNSSANFNRTFKRIMGRVPSSFRS